MKPLSNIVSLLLCLYLTYCSFQTSIFKSANQILHLTTNDVKGKNH